MIMNTPETALNFDPTPLGQTGVSLDLTAGPVDRPVYGSIDNMNVGDRLGLARASIWHTDRLDRDQFAGLGRLLSLLSGQTQGFYGLSPEITDAKTKAEVGAMSDMYDVARGNR